MHGQNTLGVGLSLDRLKCGYSSQPLGASPCQVAAPGPRAPSGHPAPSLRWGAGLQFKVWGFRELGASGFELKGFGLRL